MQHIKDERSDDDMIEELRSHLVQSVVRRMQSDVPIGIYLSGGIDSATIAGIVADELKRNPKNYGHQTRPAMCFNVGFDVGTEFDEMREVDSLFTHMRDADP